MESALLISLMTTLEPQRAWSALNAGVIITWDKDTPDRWAAVSVGYGGSGTQESATLFNDPSNYQVIVASHSFASDWDEFQTGLDEDECHVSIEACQEVSDATWEHAQRLIGNLSFEPYIRFDEDAGLWSCEASTLDTLTLREGPAGSTRDGQRLYTSDNVSYGLMEELGAVYFINAVTGLARPIDIDAWL